MNALAGLFVFLFLVACLCLFPALSLLVSRRWGKPLSRALFIMVLVVQIIVLARLYYHPLITFAETIEDPLRIEKELWANEILAGPYSGFYSSRLPILAYRFQITALSDDYIAAKIYYLPIGSIEVEWDKEYLYNITRPLR